MSVSGVNNLRGVLQQLQASATQANAPKPAPLVGDSGERPSFADALVSAIDKVDGMKKTAGAEGQAFERGDTNIGINDVMVDMQKAGLAFEMGVQVRNRVVTAYKDIMNMQV